MGFLLDYLIKILSRIVKVLYGNIVNKTFQSINVYHVVSRGNIFTLIQESASMHSFMNC